MGKKTVLPLILAFVVAALAVPYFMGAFDDDNATQAEPTAEGSEEAEQAQAAADASSDDTSSSSDGSPAEDLIVDDLVQTSDPTSSSAEQIRSRLDPLTAASEDDVEPFQTPEPTTLYQATLAHPAHTQSDLHYVERLQPLPAELDRALARVVLAHGVSTQMMAQENPAPGTELAAAVTIATALDEAMPTLERYVDHPVWDRTTDEADDEAQSHRTRIEAPPLDEALLDLYAALGYDQDTIDTVEPQARQAADELGPAESQALARVLHAQAEVQRAAAASLLTVAVPASHPQGPVQDATRTVDDQLQGSPLEELTAATETLRAAVQDAHTTIDEATGEDLPDDEDAPGEEDTPDQPEGVREEPWVDPLGLIVVGTNGDDTYDARFGGDPLVRSTVAGADQARSTIGDAGAGTGDADTVPTADQARDGTAEGDVQADVEGSTVPDAGWHMLVLDPGGDDTYRDNAGGIDAGSVFVRGTADTTNPLDGAKTVIVRDDQVCDPLLGLCEPRATDTPSLASILGDIVAPGVATDTGGIPTGMPLTAAAVDAGGDDTYKDTGPVIQGAARGIGVGILADREGDDTYNATAMAQGATTSFGVGILADGAGNDTYRAEAGAQGFADVPDVNATLDPSIPGPQTTEIKLQLLRFTEAGLLDTGGSDDYQLDDLFTGQGFVEIREGLAREAIANGYPAEEATAQLVDVGGGDQLPIPEREVDRETEQMRPSRANVSGEETAHFWTTRRAPGDNGESVGFFIVDGTPEATTSEGRQFARYKTALQASPQALPDPIGEDAIRAGSVTFDCHEFEDEDFRSIAETLGCGFGGAAANTPQLLLVGEPDVVEDPPALTLTFGGDTRYEGEIAHVDPTTDEDEGQVAFLSGGLSRSLTPRTVVDLEGDDTYTGENETVGYAQEAGLAMVVDREGEDTIDAGNRSVAYAEVKRSAGANRAPVAAVLDLDSDLTVRSDRRSQAFASQLEDTALLGDRSLSSDEYDLSPVLSSVPPMALLDAGAATEQTQAVAEDEDTHLPGGSAHFQAGNASQGYSEGLGLAMVVGSPGDDTYEVDGWGQGVHDQQQGLARFCGQNGAVGTLDPWLGGMGLVVDPDGDDTYRVEGDVGLGDGRFDSASCADGTAAVSLTGPNNVVDVLGVGTVVDVRGQDDYTITEQPPRPPSFHDRSCSGPNRTECEPHDDRAWTVIDEQPITDVLNTLGTFHSASIVGLGVDNVRNVHHAAAAACRGYDSFEPDRRYAGEAADRPLNELQCDENVRLIWDEALGDIVGGLPTRDISLEVSLPTGGEDIDVATGQATNPGDDLILDRFPLPADVVSVDEDPQPAALEDVADARCEDGETSREVTARGRGDLGCLSLTREVDLGQWITNDPAADRLDPGDTVACNCSVRLQVEPDQDSRSISLRTLADEGLYPDRGTVTTLTNETQTWYDAFNRFRVPITAEQPIQNGRLRGDFAEAEAAADFPVNLSALPTGLARVEVTAVVEDTASEESGGLVEEAERTWQRTIVHERSFTQTHLAEHDGDSVLFLEAPGPVDPDEKPQLAVNATDAVADELTSEDWVATDEGTYEHDLPRSAVVDGTSTAAVPQVGPQGCAARLLDVRSDGEGVCWTGDSFVVGLPLGEVDPSAVEDLTVGDDRLPVTTLEFPDSDAEPEFTFGAEERERADIDEIDSPDVQGVPGTRALAEGGKLAEAFIDERPNERWLELTVAPTQDEAVSIAPLTPDAPDVITQPFQAHEATEHQDFYRATGDANTSHPHVEVVTASGDANKGDPVLIEGEPRLGVDRHVLGCADLNYAPVDDVGDQIREEFLREIGELAYESRTCVTFPDDGTLTYLVPLAEYKGTQLVRLQTELLQTDGETVTQEIVGHVDPRGVQGQAGVKPAAAGVPQTEVQLQMFPQTADEPRLTSGESDLSEISLQVRGPDDETWTDLGDRFDRLPTPTRPTVETELDLSAYVDEDADTSRVEIRGVFQDESNNTLPTDAREFVLDRSPPNVTETRVVAGEEQAHLVLTVDEAIGSVSCVEEECPLEADERIPGAQPEPFLDMTRKEIGPREIRIPVLNLQTGPTYEASLAITDTLGNTAVRNVTADTFTPLQVDASAMEDTLVNKTITLNWTTETRGAQTLSTFTSAYLLLPGGPCPVLQANPGVVPARETQTLEEGPLSVESGTEEACQVPGAGVDADLVLYALAPDEETIAVDRVPLHVDTADPQVNLTAPEGWINGTTEVQVRSEDPLDTELELFVDEQAQRINGESGSATVTGEGVHDVLARATDEAGNVGANRTEVRIDRTSPGASAEVLGVRGGLALVNATATDELSGVQDVQLLTRSTAGPRVPDVGGQSVLLSVPVEPDEEELVLRVRDQANNIQDLRLPIEDVPRAESGTLVANLDLATPSPDQLHASFETANETTPVVIVDAGEEHVEKALEPGYEHEVTIDPLPPGSEAEITITIPRGSDLVPALNATAPMPEDNQPPTKLADVQAQPVEGGVELTWEPADDNVGVREVLVHRDGGEIARTASGSYVDEPPVFDEHTYKLAAVDGAGNRGPWTEVAAEPEATFRITDLTTTPEALAPDETVEIEATVQTPAGLQPDLVTVSVGEETLPMKRVEDGPYSSTFKVETRLPTLNVADDDTELVVNVTDGDRSETETYPAPVVASMGPAGDADPDEVPSLGITAALAALGTVALARRRWCI